MVRMVGSRCNSLSYALKMFTILINFSREVGEKCRSIICEQLHKHGGWGDVVGACYMCGCG